jgi:transcriptional regulator with XRE-family HTH domain
MCAEMTQNEVSEHLGISQAAYSRLETGEVELSVLKLLELCDLYGVKACDVVTDV